MANSKSSSPKPQQKAAPKGKGAPTSKKGKNNGGSVSWLHILLAVVIGLGGVAYMLTNESFQLLPRGNAPGALDLMQKSVERDRVQTMIDQYDANQHSGEQRNIDGKTQEIVDAYYNMATDFYEMGWGESFHFAHTLKDESHIDSIVRHEKRIADTLKVGPGKHILDAGCGVGGPARTIANYTQAKLTGVTLNRYQVERARVHNKHYGLEHLVTIQQADFTRLPFEDATFDGAYAIEATCHAPSLAAVYGEIFRVLKPGAYFSTYEWIHAAGFDPNNQLHKDINFEIEFGNGLPPLRSIKDVYEAAAQVGFKVVYDHDIAEDQENTRPWYYKLDMGWFSHKLTHLTCSITEFLGLAPKGTVDIHAMLLRAADGLVRGGKNNVFTPMWLVTMQKPE